MNKRAAAIAVIAFLGMIDAIFLAASRGIVPCTFSGGGCHDVLTSAYSTVAGIPLPWFGLAFYLFAFSLAIFQLSGNGETLRWLFWPALAGFLVSMTLVGVQAFILDAYCEYCLASAAMVTTIFILCVSLRLRPSSGSEPAQS